MVGVEWGTNLHAVDQRKWCFIIYRINAKSNCRKHRSAEIKARSLGPGNCRAFKMRKFPQTCSLCLSSSVSLFCLHFSFPVSFWHFKIIIPYGVKSVLCIYVYITDIICVYAYMCVSIYVCVWTSLNVKGCLFLYILL